MTTAITERPQTTPAAIERALIGGDLSRLTEAERLSYYNQVCQSLGLNPLTKPFAYITLNGKLTLYALKDCTEQLRNTRKVSIQIVAREATEDCYVVTARAVMPDGRCDESIGAVPLGTLKGEARANAIMKCETKAKRRVTLSICGLGMLDEIEVESIPQTPVIEAPKRIAPATLPAGTVQILSSQTGAWGGSDVVVVDVHGVETTHKTRDRELGALCEQLTQEGVPVTLEFTPLKRGKNAGRLELTGVKRWVAPSAEPIAPVEPLPVKDLPF